MTGIPLLLFQLEGNQQFVYLYLWHYSLTLIKYKINLLFSSYRAVNTLRLGYETQPINAVQGKKKLFVLRSIQNT
jgi:hypothetical protein